MIMSGPFGGALRESLDEVRANQTPGAGRDRLSTRAMAPDDISCALDCHNDGARSRFGVVRMGPVVRATDRWCSVMVGSFVAIWVAVAALLAPPASAADFWKDCGGDDPVVGIRACTEVIAAGKAYVVEAYMLRGLWYLKQGDLRRARSDLDEVVRRRPDYAPPYYSRAQIHFRNKAFRQALADVDTMLRLAPGNAAAFVLRQQIVQAQTAAAATTAPPPSVTVPPPAASPAPPTTSRPQSTVTAQVAPPAVAAPAEATPPVAVSRGARVALVIGNGAYGQIGTLRNPVRDAAAVTATLRELGFAVTTVVDADRAHFSKALRSFSEAADNADVALVYYSGHAVQIARGASAENFLLPVDAKLGDVRDVEEEAIRLGLVLDRIGRSKAKIVILDACRDNPFIGRIAATTRSVPTRGLARREHAVGDGSIVVFATAPNSVAADGDGELSPFTQAFVRHAATPGLEFRVMLGRARAQVVEATNGRQ